MANHSYSMAISFWSDGLNDVSKAVNDCGLASELSYMQQEANALGFGNVTVLGTAASVLVHGSDVYENLFSAFQAFESHDYRTAGSDLGAVMNDLSQWTTNHSCTADCCYVVTGIMQFLGDIQGDIRACQSDFQRAFGNFTKAYSEMHGGRVGGGDFHFNTDTKMIQKGVKAIGYGLLDIAAGVGECHLAQLSEIVSALAVKLGIVPEVGWFEEVLKILINGVQIEQGVGQACLDFGDGNWVGFGYNIAKLIRTLITGDITTQIAQTPLIAA